MFKKLIGFGVIAAIVGVLAAALVVIFYPVPEPNDFAVAEATEVYYADGTLIAQVGDITRTSVPLDRVPIEVQQAVLAAEDRSFYDHQGFSPVGIGRALYNNVRGGPTQGGSTITQQYVKNAFLTQDQSMIRKLQELVLSVKLEIAVSKDEILEGYLNTIYFGRGAYGIEAASQAYFGKPVDQMTAAEGAALAGLIQSPGNYEPELFPEALQGRFDYVVNGKVEEGWMTPAEAATMAMPAFIPRDTSNRYGGQIGYLIEETKAELRKAGFSDAEIVGGGLRVTTSIDPLAQSAMETAVAEEGPESNTEGLRIGMVSVDPRNGAILAMYGGPDYITSPLNNATQAIAQAGSTFKPFALAEAFKQGISTDSRWNGNSPATIAGYTLQNEGNKSYGTVTLNRATELSINTPYVRLTSELGVANVIETAHQIGLPRDTKGVNEDLTFVLGSASPNVLDMAGAYSTFAARGIYHEPSMLTEVKNIDGATLYTRPVAGEDRLDAEIADSVNQTLQRVVTNGTATRAQQLNREVAGKTGTTDDNMSAWFIGYTPQVVTAVMMSKEDENGNPVTLRGTGGMSQVFGSSFPLRMFVAANKPYLADQEKLEFANPSGDLSSPGRSGGDSEPESQPSSSPTPTEEPTPTPEPTLSPTPEPTPTEEPTSAAEPTPSAPPPSPASAPEAPAAPATTQNRTPPTKPEQPAP